MADNTEIYRNKFVEVLEIPAPDDLVIGFSRADSVIAKGTQLERGTLLMSSGDGFIPATQEGVSSAEEVCILASRVNNEEEGYSYIVGYFAGEFNGARVILPYETEENDHTELLKNIVPALRKRGIYLQI